MSKVDGTFDAQAEVEWVRNRRAEARRRLYCKSRLDRYRAELVAMKQAGASCADLVEWHLSRAESFGTDGSRTLMLLSSLSNWFAIKLQPDGIERL